MSVWQRLRPLGGGRLPVIIQSEASECGLACLAMIASYYGHRTSIEELRRAYPISLQGTTLRQIYGIAGELGFRCRAVKLDLDELHKLTTPAILHWELNHFVVLKKVTRRSAVIHNPAIGERRYSREELSRFFTGVALEPVPGESFESKPAPAGLKVWDLWDRVVGLRRSAVQVFVLSLVLHAMMLVAPFYVQLVIDEVVQNQDTDLLLTLAVGFGIVYLLRELSRVIRSYTVLYIGQLFNGQMTANIGNHLMRLPLAFFAKRHLGDIITRMQSVEHVRKVFTEEVVVGVVDGIIAVVTLVVIFLYSPLLSFIVLAALVIYSGLRIFLFNRFRTAQQEHLMAQAQERSKFMELVRGIYSLKANNRQANLSQRWSDELVDSLNKDARAQRIDILLDFGGKVVRAAENLLVVYFGAQLILEATITIGMFYAFTTYKDHFADRLQSLIERLFEIRLLNLHMDRLSDIVVQEPEQDQVEPPAILQPVYGGLALEGVGYRFGATESPVLQNIDLTVARGERVAITGPSGAGKSTLLKILMGLLPPSEGAVYVDGRPLGELGVTHLREQSASVLQEDQLFSGSIAQNITFFSLEPDFERMRWAAEQACIDGDIQAMSMGYQSLVGDMGTALSSGQKQRVMIARALYRQPQILFLDEATANLDRATERQVLDNLFAQPATIVFVSHAAAVEGHVDRHLALWPGGAGLVDQNG